MSSGTVREAMKTAWADLVPTIPLVETINDTPDTIPESPIWATFIFDVTSSGPVTMGSDPWFEELGVAMVALMSYSGEGDLTVAAVAEDVIKAWRLWISPDKAIWIQSADGPRPPDMETAGNSYRLSVNLNYAYQSRGG